MIAILRQQIVFWPEKFGADFLDDVLDLIGRAEGEALDHRAAESAAGRHVSWRSIVDASGIALRMAAVSVFMVLDHDAGVEEGRTTSPEDRGQPAGLRGAGIS